MALHRARDSTPAPVKNTSAKVTQENQHDCDGTECPSFTHAPAPSICLGLLVVVDLSALQLVGIIDVHGLPLSEEIDRSDSCFAVPVTGLFGAAEGQVSLRTNGRRIYVDNSCVEVASGLESAVHVARVDGS